MTLPRLPEPATASEHQVLVTLRAGAELAATIDVHRRRVDGYPAGDLRRRRAGALLADATERLVNLLTLLLNSLEARDIGPPIADAVRAHVRKLRQGLLKTGAELAVGRAAEVRQRALTVLESRSGRPLSLAPRLRLVLTVVWETVEVLGGPESLSEAGRLTLGEAEAAVVQLTALESVGAVLIDFEDSRSHAEPE